MAAHDHAEGPPGHRGRLDAARQPSSESRVGKADDSHDHDHGPTGGPSETRGGCQESSKPSSEVAAILSMSTSWVYREASKLGLRGYKLGRGRNAKVLYKRAERASVRRPPFDAIDAPKGTSGTASNEAAPPDSAHAPAQLTVGAEPEDQLLLQLDIGPNVLKSHPLRPDHLHRPPQGSELQIIDARYELALGTPSRTEHALPDHDVPEW